MQHSACGIVKENLYQGFGHRGQTGVALGEIGPKGDSFRLKGMGGVGFLGSVARPSNLTLA